MLLYGAGGHAKVILDGLKEKQIKCHGVFDDYANALYFYQNYKILGNYRPEVEPKAPLLMAVGDNYSRKYLRGRVKHAFGQLVRDSAHISPTAELGEGAVVLPRAVVGASARAGRHAVVNTGAILEHDAELGAYAHLAPGAVVCGHAKIGEGTLIGPGAVVEKEIVVGRWCVVAAGAVVAGPLPDFSVAMGVPARVVRQAEHKPAMDEDY